MAGLDMSTMAPLALCAALALLTPLRAAAEPPAPADLAAEEAFLKILPKVEVPEDVQPISGAVNEEWRRCQTLWPNEYRQTQAGPEARAYRDIYGNVQARAVIERRDCTCDAKVANWETVEGVAAELRKSTGVEILKWAQTQDISDEADRLIAIAEVMCGGRF